LEALDALAEWVELVALEVLAASAGWVVLGALAALVEWVASAVSGEATGNTIRRIGAERPMVTAPPLTASAVRLAATHSRTGRPVHVRTSRGAAGELVRTVEAGDFPETTEVQAA
jgi:hypothetical protein